MQTECGVPGPRRRGQEAQGAGSRDPRAWPCVCVCLQSHLRSVPLDKPEPGGSTSRCVLGRPSLCAVGAG